MPPATAISMAMARACCCRSLLRRHRHDAAASDVESGSEPPAIPLPSPPWRRLLLSQSAAAPPPPPAALPMARAAMRDHQRIPLPSPHGAVYCCRQSACRRHRRHQPASDVESGSETARPPAIPIPSSPWRRRLQPVDTNAVPCYLLLDSYTHSRSYGSSLRIRRV